MTRHSPAGWATPRERSREPGLAWSASRGIGTAHSHQPLICSDRRRSRGARRLVSWPAASPLPQGVLEMTDLVMRPLRIALISEHASPAALLGGEDAGGQNVYVDEVSRELTRVGHR